MPFAADRRRFLAAGGLLGLGGCAAGSAGPGYLRGLPGYAPAGLAPVRAASDRLFDITVCLRPFRAAGPRMDVEQVAGKTVIHNYGHGGSGWSLSWGAGTLAVEKAMASSPREVAVIGCGALGLTAATLAQRAGAQVTIYARDLLPQARSARATGSWTPDSRIALVEQAGAQFGALWEQMARTSFKSFRQYLGLLGEPVEWTDRYTLADQAITFPRVAEAGGNGMLAFGHYNERVADLQPRPELMPRGATPFDAPFVYRSESMMFNIADYGHTLMTDFFAAGGRFRRTEFHSPADLAHIAEAVVINCPGYGARELWADESVVPVRGQIAWLIPQPEVRYGLVYRDVSVLSRRDGIVVQAVEGGDMKGYNDTREVADRAEADAAVAKIADLFTRFGRRRA